MMVYAETQKGQYVKDAKVDELLYEEAKGVKEVLLRAADLWARWRACCSRVQDAHAYCHC
jgi:hypothetical protein